MAVLKLFRNKNHYADHDSAKQAIISQFSLTKFVPGEGQVVIATYGDSDNSSENKTIVGIKHLGGITYFDNESITNEMSTIISNAINDLDVTDTAVSKKFVTSVSETDGKINVSRGEITTDGTVALADNTDGGIKLSVNIDNDTITSDTNGIISVASSALTQYVGEKAINIDEEADAENKKTVSLIIPSSEKVLSQDENGLISTISIVKNSSPNETNVLEEYTLQGINSSVLGDTIKIYKDSSLVNFYLGHIDDTLTDADTTGESVTTTITSGSGATALVYVVQLANGNYKLTAVDVSNFLEESEFNDGLEVKNHVVNVKIDDDSEKIITEYGDTNTTSPVLSVSSNGIKISNVQSAIDAKIGTLDYDKTEVSDATKGFIKTSISETDGIVKNENVEVTYGDYNTESQTDGIATTSSTKSYIDTAIGNKNVDVEGDDYVGASAANNKVTIETNVQSLTATAGSVTVYNSDGTTLTEAVEPTLEGTAKSLADSSDIAEKVKTYTNGKIEIEIDKAIKSLDSTISSNLTEENAVSEGNHIGAKIIETDGKLSSLTVVENDIASADALTTETSRAKLAETSIDSAIGLTKSTEDETRSYSNNGTYIGKNSNGNTIASDISALDVALANVDDNMLTEIEAGNGIDVTEKADKKQTISIKLDDTTIYDETVDTASDNALTVSEKGLYLSHYIDCGTY